MLPDVAIVTIETAKTFINSYTMSMFLNGFRVFSLRFVGNNSTHFLNVLLRKTKVLNYIKNSEIVTSL